ncbi:MAG: DM13 domain-containing protein [Sediminibacterium sp.]
MKFKILIVLVSVGILSACTKQNATPNIQLMESIDSLTRTSMKGNFMNGPFGTVSGNAFISVINNEKKLILENLASSNGPDLHVYLSKEIQPINFIDLGKLKSVNGTQVYSIDNNVNLKDFKFALVHCQQFNHLFGSANIQ